MWAGGLCALLALALLVYVRLKVTYRKRITRVLKRLPGPNGDWKPAGGSLAPRISDMLHLAQEHGPIFAAPLSQDDPTSRSVVIADGPLAHEVCVKKSAKYTRILQYSAIEPLLGSSALVLQQGKSHRRMRNRLLPLFQQEHVDRVFSHVQTAIHAMTERWRELPERTCTTVKRDMEICVVQAALGTFFGVGGVSRERVSGLIEAVKVSMKALIGEGDHGEANAHARAYGGWRGMANRVLYGNQAENRLNSALATINTELRWLEARSRDDGVGGKSTLQCSRGSLFTVLSGEPWGVVRDQGVGIVFAVLNMVL